MVFRSKKVWFFLHFEMFDRFFAFFFQSFRTQALSWPDLGSGDSGDSLDIPGRKIILIISVVNSLH